MRIFIDLDGVLADFDTGHEQQIGHRPNKEKDDVDWRVLKDTPGFFQRLPKMAGADELWEEFAPFEPTILTGCPTSFHNEAALDKKAWVMTHFGIHVPMIACKSAEKFMHGQPGDLLIDDWTKYKSKWEEMGGHWITHVHHETTIADFWALRARLGI